MADSWEDIDKQQQSVKPAGLNPGASSFTFNPAVASWTPGGLAPAASAASGVFTVSFNWCIYFVLRSVSNKCHRDGTFESAARVAPPIFSAVVARQDKVLYLLQYSTAIVLVYVSRLRARAQCHSYVVMRDYVNGTTILMAAAGCAGTHE